MYRANQLWIVAEEDLKDMLTPGLTLRMLPGRTMVLCESAEEVDKWARQVPDGAGFMDDYEPQYQPYMQQIYDCIVVLHEHLVRRSGDCRGERHSERGDVPAGRPARTELPGVLLLRCGQLRCGVLAGGVRPGGCAPVYPAGALPVL